MSSRQSAEETCIDVAPDLVTAYDGFNDISSRTWFDPRIGVPSNWVGIKEQHLRGERAVSWRDADHRTGNAHVFCGSLR
jgi:hypothetical protein